MMYQELHRPPPPELAPNVDGNKPRIWWKSILCRISPVLFALVLAFVGTLSLIWAFGSLATAAAYLSGHGLIVAEFEKDLGVLPFGEHRQITYTLQNLSGREVALIGANSPCTCTQTMALPARIPAGQRFEFQIVYRSERAGPFYEELKIFTDDPVDATLAVRLRGLVERPTKAGLAPVVSGDAVSPETTSSGTCLKLNGPKGYSAAVAVCESIAVIDSERFVWFHWHNHAER